MVSLTYVHTPVRAPQKYQSAMDGATKSPSTFTQSDKVDWGNLADYLADVYPTYHVTVSAIRLEDPCVCAQSLHTRPQNRVPLCAG